MGPGSRRASNKKQKKKRAGRAHNGNRQGRAPGTPGRAARTKNVAPQSRRSRPAGRTGGGRRSGLIDADLGLSPPAYDARRPWRGDRITRRTGRPTRRSAKVCAARRWRRGLATGVRVDARGSLSVGANRRPTIWRDRAGKSRMATSARRTPRCKHATAPPGAASIGEDRAHPLTSPRGRDVSRMPPAMRGHRDGHGRRRKQPGERRLMRCSSVLIPEKRCV